MFKTLKNILAVAVSISLLTISNAVADGHMAAIKKWSNGEFSLSTISAKEREKELQWFYDATKPFKEWKSTYCQKLFQLTNMNQKL